MGAEVQIGDRNRVDLVLNAVVAIELKFGKLKANERNRVLGQSVTYAQRWYGRGPLLVICFGAPADRVSHVTDQARRWNKDLGGDSADLPAPILVISQTGGPV